MEEKKENAVPECRKNNDLRTFMIALLTSVIVVALYHFGSGLCKIYCPENCGGYYPTQRYMLVPVMDVPMMHGMGEGGMHHHRGHGKFGMKKPGFRDGGMNPEWKRGPGFKGKRPARRGPDAAPEAKAPAGKPAPKAPAPAK